MVLDLITITVDSGQAGYFKIHADIWAGALWQVCQSADGSHCWVLPIILSMVSCAWFIASMHCFWARSTLNEAHRLCARNSLTDRMGTGWWTLWLWCHCSNIMATTVEWNQLYWDFHSDHWKSNLLDVVAGLLSCTAATCPIHVLFLTRAHVQGVKQSVCMSVIVLVVVRTHVDFSTMIELT